MKLPRVTVLMPVFNAGIYLNSAIESILSQSFTDFEFLIIDDGSQDDTGAQLGRYQDPRLRVETNATNLGLVHSLNRGVALARGEYIARMDGDDFSLPERLAIQVDYMDSRPEVGICGSWVRVMGSSPPEIWSYPQDHEAITCRLLFASTLAHPSVIMRRSVLISRGLQYRSERTTAEDYAFWCECSRHTRLANIPQVLLEYRVPAQRPNLAEYRKTQQEVSDQVRLSELSRLGIDASPEELSLHRDIALGRHRATHEYMMASREWLERIQITNQGRQVIAPEALVKDLGGRWLEICRNASNLGWTTWKIYHGSTLSADLHKDSPAHWNFFRSCFYNQAKKYLHMG